MNNLRNVLRILMALVLATLAFPALADDDSDWWKQYNLDMAIVSAPPAQANPPFTVTAKIRNTGLLPIGSFTLTATGLTIVSVSQPGNGGKVTGPFPGQSVSITHMFPLFFSESLTLTLQVNSCGDGTWKTVAWAGEFLNGPSLDLDADDSALETSITCASVASGKPFTVPDSLNPNCVTGERGYYDKDGSIPEGALPIVVTNTVPTNFQLHFQWPDSLSESGGDPLATFQYTVCGSGPLPEDLTPPQDTFVAWLNTDGSSASSPGTAAYIMAQNCNANADFLPAPYGTLVMDSGGTKITLNTDPKQTPSVQGLIHPPKKPDGTDDLPFDIVIGTERMTVTACADSDDLKGGETDNMECGELEEPEVWTVTRPVGKTTQVTHQGGLVMSTPLPLLGSTVSCVDANGVALLATSCKYVALSPALMCIQNQMVVDPETGPHSTTFIDIGGDGWANHP